MKILICGLPGTGKTTLTKMISEQFNMRRVSDWDIFKQHEIKICETENKNYISKRYSELLMKEINKSNNVVVDLEYSISPNDFINFNSKDCIIIYLGFVKVGELDLYNVFRNSSSNSKYTNEDLKEKVSFYKQMSCDYKKQCIKNNLKFFDVNKDRKEIFKASLDFLNMNLRNFN